MGRRGWRDQMWHDGMWDGEPRTRDDAGGVWIVTGWVVGLVVYAGVVVAWHAGFTAAAPFVVIPAVLAVMIGGGNLINGRRSHRPPPRFNRPDPVTLDSLRPGGAAAPPGGAAEGPASEGPGADR